MTGNGTGVETGFTYPVQQVFNLGPRGPRLICNAAYDREPHGLCVTGAPLIQTPQGCIWSDHTPTDQEMREKVINGVCVQDNSSGDRALPDRERCASARKKSTRTDEPKHPDDNYPRPN
jgi:hypothetical protein